MRTTNIKFTGLASGLDTEAMVQAMVMPYKTKFDKGVQQEKLLELKKDKWKDVNNKVLNFYKEHVDKLRLESSFLTKKTSLSNPNLVDFKGDFSEGTHTIEILQLAKKASVNTSNIKHDEKTSLQELGFVKGDNINIQIGDKTVVVPIDEITETDAAGNETKRLMNIEELEKKVNQAVKDDPALSKEAKAGFDFRFDKNAKGFIISSQSESIQVTSNNSAALGQLGIDSTKADPTVAKVKYNGMTIQSNTNEITVDGATITLKGTGTVTVSTAHDTEGMFEMIVGFADQYNKMIDEFRGLIDAPYNKDYMPLTDEQKKDMSEEDIKLWNEKVEKSLLRKDPTLEKLLSSMRGILGENVKGNSFGSLANIGLEPSRNYKDHGKIIVDEEKLKKAIETNAEDVMKLFATNGSEEEGKLAFIEETKLNEPTLTDAQLEEKWNNLGKETKDVWTKKTQGVGDKLYDALTEMFKGSEIKSSMFLFNDKVLEESIKHQKSEVNKLEERMMNAENRYYKQFAAMEKMMNQLNSQSSWLTSQIGGM